MVLAGPSSVAIAQTSPCPPASDEFSAGSLEKCRWTNIVREDATRYRVQNGRLFIDAGQGEVQDSAPNLIGQPAPAGPWVAETDINLTTTAEGQQAGLLYYKSATNWIKAVLVDKGATSQIELVRVKDGTYLLDGQFKVDVPSTLTSFKLRLRSNGTTMTAQYSTNGQTWTEVGQARDVTDLAGGYVGPMALTGGAPAVTASFDYVRIEVPAPNLFTTIGITRSETRQNSQINGNPTPYSLPAEEMPPSRTVGPAPSDATDDVPLRMPDTSGNVPNLAAFRGQTLTLRADDQKVFSKLHFFGTTSDGGPAGGDFVLRFDDGTTETINVQFRDWCAAENNTAGDHIAIGRLTQRYRTSGGDTAQCSIYHVPKNVATAKKLVSVQLPPNTSPGNPPIQAYLMALTLEEPGGAFETPDLSGQIANPDDQTAPVTTHTLNPAAPTGQDGWYRGGVVIRLTSADTDVEQTGYRIDGGPTQPYTGQFTFSQDGVHTIEYRSIDASGNAEGFKPIPLKVDATPPSTTIRTTPGAPLGAQAWHDGAVRLALAVADGAGSGAGLTEYRVNNGAWQAYNGPVTLAEAGTHTVDYRTKDIAGNQETYKTATIRVDGTAPLTSARINGAEPVAEYTGPVRVGFVRTDGDGSGAAGTEYRIGDGAWTPYEAAFEVAGNRGHRIDFRSWDLAGNVENFRSVIFTIRPPAVTPTPTPTPRPSVAQAAPVPPPFAALAELTSRRSTLASLTGRGLQVRIACQSVTRGTVTLTTSKATARRLGLKSATLGRAAVRCGDEGRATVRLRPAKAVRRALAKSKRAVRGTLALRMAHRAGAATDRLTVVLSAKRARR